MRRTTRCTHKFDLKSGDQFCDLRACEFSALIVVQLLNFQTRSGHRVHKKCSDLDVLRALVGVRKLFCKRERRAQLASNDPPFVWSLRSKSSIC